MWAGAPPHCHLRCKHSTIFSMFGFLMHYIATAPEKFFHDFVGPFRMMIRSLIRNASSSSALVPSWPAISSNFFHPAIQIYPSWLPNIQAQVSHFYTNISHPGAILGWYESSCTICFPSCIKFVFVFQFHPQQTTLSRTPSFSLSFSPQHWRGVQLGSQFEQVAPTTSSNLLFTRASHALLRAHTQTRISLIFSHFLLSLTIGRGCQEVRS